MKKGIFFIIIYLVVGCIASTDDDPSLTDVWFDGCEYVKSDVGITHEGNCRNSQHR